MAYRIGHELAAGHCEAMATEYDGWAERYRARENASELKGNAVERRHWREMVAWAESRTREYRERAAEPKTVSGYDWH